MQHVSGLSLVCLVSLALGWLENTLENALSLYGIYVVSIETGGPRTTLVSLVLWLDVRVIPAHPWWRPVCRLERAWIKCSEGRLA